MFEISITKGQSRRLLRKIKRIPDGFNELVTKVTERGRQRLVDEGESESVTSKTVNSISTKVVNGVGHIFSKLDYAMNSLEYGRAPGKIKAKELERWAGLKLGDKKLAYPIALSIARKGTRKFREGGPRLVSRTEKKIKGEIIPSELNKFRSRLFR